MNAIEKVMQTNAVSKISAAKRMLKVHAWKTESFFEKIFQMARKLKMVVNQKKTQILCISAAKHDVVSTYVRPKIDGQAEEICSTDSLKIIGFNFDSTPTVRSHVNIMCKKFQGKLWSMRKLKAAGMKPVDLLNIYTSVP